MAIVLDRIDSVPLSSDELSTELKAWLTVLVDSLNTIVQVTENGFNNLAAPQYTTLQIAALLADAPNGSIYYDTDLNQLQAKVNGVLVVL